MDKKAHIYYQGQKLQVEFYVDEKGEIPVKDYLKGLSEKINIKLSTLVKLIANEGRIYNEQKYRIVDKNDKIYEFKPMRYRFFNFFHDGSKLIITNGYMKKSQKVSKKELERARKIKREYKRRVGGGEYYD